MILRLDNLTLITVYNHLLIHNNCSFLHEIHSYKWVHLAIPTYSYERIHIPKHKKTLILQDSPLTKYRLFCRQIPFVQPKVTIKNTAFLQITLRLYVTMKIIFLLQKNKKTLAIFLQSVK